MFPARISDNEIVFCSLSPEVDGGLISSTFLFDTSSRRRRRRRSCGGEPRVQLDELLGEQRQLRASVPIYGGGQTGVHLWEGKPARYRSAFMCRFVDVRCCFCCSFLAYLACGGFGDSFRAAAWLWARCRSWFQLSFAKKNGRTWELFIQDSGWFKVNNFQPQQKGSAWSLLNFKRIIVVAFTSFKVVPWPRTYKKFSVSLEKLVKNFLSMKMKMKSQHIFICLHKWNVLYKY